MRAELSDFHMITGFMPVYVSIIFIRHHFEKFSYNTTDMSYVLITYSLSFIT